MATLGVERRRERRVLRRRGGGERGGVLLFGAAELPRVRRLLAGVHVSLQLADLLHPLLSLLQVGVQPQRLPQVFRRLVEVL